MRARIVSGRAYEKAGLGPQDVHVAEVHDASSSGEIAQVEALGLCAPGQAGHDAEAGATALGGRVPVNVSGGLVSKGHPLGATGAKLFTTMLNELERTGGRYGLQTMCEGGGTANVTIIERL